MLSQSNTLCLEKGTAQAQKDTHKPRFDPCLGEEERTELSE